MSKQDKNPPPNLESGLEASLETSLDTSLEASLETNLDTSLDTSLDTTQDNGLQVLDLFSYPAFADRPTHPRDPARQSIGMERIARALIDAPDTILQQLVNSAIDLCGADSAGVSIQETDQHGVVSYHWVAIAGEYARFLDAILPLKPSACTTCLERNRPQLFRVSEPFFKLINVVAEPVTDGLLLPWNAGPARGTIWIAAHGRTQAFDQDDLDMMIVFGSFAALGVVHQQRQKAQRKIWAATAANAVADALARRVDHPLQRLTDLILIAANGKSRGDSVALAKSLTHPLQQLTALLEELAGRSFTSYPN